MEVSRSAQAVAAVLLTIYASSAVAFVPAAGVLRSPVCRAGVCPQLGLRLGGWHGQARPASPRSGRADSIVMMAKKKMTEAQLKALEALEAFEAVTGAVEEEEISPAEEEKRKKREEKRAKKAAKKNAEEGIVAGDSEVSSDTVYICTNTYTQI